MNGSIKRSTELDLVSAYLRGFIEGSLIKAAATELQCAPEELTSRLGRAWVPAIREQNPKKLPILSKKGTRNNRTVERVGVSRSSHSEVPKTAVKKRKLSAAARKRIGDATRARWKRVHVEQKKAA